MPSSIARPPLSASSNARRRRTNLQNWVITYHRFYPAGQTIHEDRPRIFHEYTKSAVIRLFVLHSGTVFSANHQHYLEW